MDISQHNLQTLFMQLGLNSDEVAIERFIVSHNLQKNEKLEEAEFWTPAQANFLSECLSADSDWAEVVDQLNVELRK